MACNCTKRNTTRFKWTSEPDENNQVQAMTYTTEIQAKAKVMRQGGSYVAQEV